MLIAREKKKSNIAEYILYMWQLEDLLRGLDLDMERIKEQLILPFRPDQETAREMYAWYDNLTEMMRLEKVQQAGHVRAVQNNVDELTELHFYLLHKAHDRRYHQLVTAAATNLVEFRSKAGAGNEISDVELALNGLYGHLLLRLRKADVSQQTRQAMDTFSKMIAYLAAQYRKMETEEERLLE
ncbi:MAG: DUF4924 family protein [Culturomica sp.]|jgi:hypothetical protein|nr:DUF4924 family protein [Culturomica sp.]